MKGYPREHASGLGDGFPVSGSSPPSASPESADQAAEHGAAVPDTPEAPAPRWQDVADAVWLAAYWNRHGGPAPSGPEHTPDRAATLPAPPPVPPREGEDPDRPDSPPTAEGDLADPIPDAVRPPREPVAPATPAPTGGPGGRRQLWADDSALPAEPAVAARLLPDAQGRLTLRLGQPLLPADDRPEQAAGRTTALFARALHQLARRVPTREALELDEETTAEQGVVDGMWMPFLRPARRAAFDLVVLVDDAPTLRIWDESTARLAQAAEHSGAFRAVRTVRVHLPRTGTATLRWTAGRAAADPAELLDGRGDRVFLVVTDGLAHGWAAPAADDLLGRLAHAGPTALVHLLPPHLRHRTSLYPHPAVLEAGGFGVANDGLEHWAPPGGPDPLRPLPDAGDGAVPVPVLSLKPGSLAAWADLVTGERGVRRALPVVLAGTLTKGSPAPGLRAPRFPAAAKAAVRRFFTLATPAARRLATQLAAIPFEFDLVEQLRRRTMPETGPDHLAEILMGGLIDWDSDGGGHPEFADGVREELLATTTRSQLAHTVSVVGELPAAGARGVALRAALRDPMGATLPDAAEGGWVRSELAVMRALSGPYSERARRIEPGPARARGPGATERVSPGTSEPAPSEVNREAHGGLSDGSGSLPPSNVPNEPGEPPVPPLVSDVTPQEPPEAEPPMPSTMTTSSAPALLVNVPLRNTSFVGRQALLSAVEEQLGAQDTAAVLPNALHGLGGVGKSQLALEYVYTHQHDYRVICWIPAERESLILAALAQLAAQLGVAPTGQDLGAPAANTAVPAVLEALRTGAPYDNWLLVFDNAEDVEAVRQFFPTNGPGKVIVTSRNRAWERVATSLPVNVFEREESVELLRKRSPDLSTEDAGRLAEALGDLPLAVEQAGAWRAVTGMQVDEYLDLLAQRSPEILELDPAPDYPVSVAAAWDISLERIKENNPGARQLLDICASMAPEPIPRAMLRGSRGVNVTPEVDPLLRESIKLNRAVRDLSQFSLVKVDPRSDTLQMHRLLQTVLLAKLSAEERERMRDAAHQLLSAAKPGPYGSSLEWRAYQALLPHVLTSQAVSSTDTYVRELVFDTVWFLYYWGDHVGAADFARQAWSAWIAASGEEDVNVLRMMKSLGFLLRQIGQVPESIPLTEKALEISRRTEVDPENLIDSLCEMADAHGYQGRFDEARALTQEATELARSLFGPDDPMTLRATHAWGVALRLCGRFKEALPLDQENAQQRELLFGPASFFTLNTLNALSIDMRESGDYPGARDFQEDAYRRARSELGEEHPLTLRVARNLAVCRRRDGAHTEAAKLAEETLRRFIARYGPDHFDAMSSATNMSVDQRLSGDLDSSRQLAEVTLRRFEQRLGANHAYTLLTKANLAATLRAQGALEQAQELEDDAASRLADRVGPRHVTTLTVAIGQANTAYARVDFERAHEIDQANLELLTEIAGEEHPLTFSCMANLALDLRGLGRGAEADELQRKATDGFARVVRADHPWLVAARQRRRIECDMAPMPL
ncbi:Tetratricopeptide repeat-containing protein [Streptomyces sp. Ag82_O1-12]|uniref:FxSxx-COOH system tetratricopeptide repeat protein n=1 Tax=unclassified Streptomyces TaxID=2593676 RepID=UPI000BCC4247|nr:MULTISPECIES: FxSxx-COOH system tetratricopeptide repeat protein [unclassified Streptomyces]SMQ19553.1 Tetratricopeptide repeat-containing protein [Streptomyces sp. Ag82_O1-12]SOD48594.1 Tetratricopeptide repeat-containing protein [Streptomyces sp. Ag82_G6-1]